MAYTGHKPIAVFDRNTKPGQYPLAMVSKQTTSIGAARAAGAKRAWWSLRFPNGDPAFPGCWIVEKESE